MSISTLIKWSKTEFSGLPWRQKRSLYRTLVSEIMLQQTTVGTVKNHYDRFLLKFPTLETLASASEDELVIAWKGLGYYRRARNLKKIAQTIQDEYGGEFPSDLNSLMEIPGIGLYTASALVAIGMDKRALAVDANLERVIARVYNIQIEKGLKLQKEIQKMFQDKRIFHGRFSFRDLNQALMDLGRTYCQSRKTSCEICPLKDECKSFSAGVSHLLPLIKKQTTLKKIDQKIHLLRIIVRKKDKILVYKKAKDEWLAGQFEVPTFILSTTDTSLKQYPRIEKKIKESLTFKTGITKYEIQNSVIILSEKEFIKLKFPVRTEWRSIQGEASNLSTATIKAMTKIHALSQSKKPRSGISRILY